MPERQAEAEILKELKSIRGLMMLLLLKLGTSSDELGAALGVSERRIQQTFPVRRIKKVNLGHLRV